MNFICYSILKRVCIQKFYFEEIKRFVDLDIETSFHIKCEHDVNSPQNKNQNGCIKITVNIECSRSRHFQVENIFMYIVS